MAIMSNRSPSNRPVPVACRSRAWGDQLWGTRHRATPVALRSSSSRSLEVTGGRDRVWAANRVIARSPGVLPQLSMRRGGLAATQTGRRNPAFSLFPLRISRCARRLHCRARNPINPGPMAFLAVAPSPCRTLCSQARKIPEADGRRGTANGPMPDQFWHQHAAVT